MVDPGYSAGKPIGVIGREGGRSPFKAFEQKLAGPTPVAQLERGLVINSQHPPANPPRLDSRLIDSLHRGLIFDEAKSRRSVTQDP
ncbi:hypothetical protein Acsp01_32100 [Actinoplanes sp. NBRC 101535]|nr:hypothetical protein Acsp01_32100 [Actinoplanes sp. NBRC 101535]